MADTNTQFNEFGKATPSGIHKYDRTIKTKQGHTRTRRVKIVCKSCNGGWMSTLQNKSKALLVSLMNEEDVTLNEEQQYLVTQWITMTAMTSEFSHRPSIAIPRSQRLQFKIDQIPPIGWYIFIGRYRGLNWDTRFRHHGGHSIDPTREAFSYSKNYNTHSTVFVVKSLAIYVLGSLNPDFINKKADFIEEFSSAYNLHSLWPPNQNELKWLDLGVNYDSDIDELADWITQIVRVPS